MNKRGLLGIIIILIAAAALFFAIYFAFLYSPAQDTEGVTVPTETETGTEAGTGTETETGAGTETGTGTGTSTGGDLSGKTIEQLMAMNTMVICDTVGLLGKGRSERLEGVSVEIPTKFYIYGQTIREDGVSIFTDGTEEPSRNIIKDGTVFSLTPATEEMMGIEDSSVVDMVLQTWYAISPESLSCSAGSPDMTVFEPANACYLPPSTKLPACNISVI